MPCMTPFLLCIDRLRTRSPADEMEPAAGNLPHCSLPLKLSGQHSRCPRWQQHQSSRQVWPPEPLQGAVAPYALLMPLLKGHPQLLQPALLSKA